MKFIDYSNDSVDFSGHKISISSELDLEKPIDKKTLIINALPAHPYNFPHLQLLFSLIDDNPSILNKLKEKYKITELIIIVSKKRRSEIALNNISAMGNLKIIYKNPVYPLTEKRISSITGVKSFSTVEWYHFYTLLSTEEHLPLKGIPVSISFPVQKTRVRMLVPPKTTVADIAKAASIRWDDSVICLDHPFLGNPVLPETEVTELRPHTFIFFPKNVRQNPSLWLKIKFMIWGSCTYSFSDTYDSRPLQLDTPCQRCLYCTTICPVNLAPHMLSALYSAENIKEAMNHSPQACIECGLCSYVCPSGIPLLHTIKRLKKEIGVSA
ncbi:MAG: 4Fe-4S dicluster domain-containing protein [Spirochaetales bacterium]|nr:4Fe-4S dicluster domain-containing protein [Spirochaetales bacterium]